MSEYKVTKVSEQEPKKFDGQYGTTYYIKVMLDGHTKPVEIGKKTPDAIKVGDVLTGTVIPTEYQTDKFKAERPGFTSGAKRVEDPAKQDSIIRQSSMKAAIDLVVSGKIELGDLYTRADSIVAWVKGEQPKTEPKLVKPESLKSDEDLAKEMLGLEEEEINLDDIQF
jgi:hypothetical protein